MILESIQSPNWEEGSNRKVRKGLNFLFGNMVASLNRKE
jgi:hypothetical protein